MGARVWLAAEDDVEAVSSLMAAFRDWWGKDTPETDRIRQTVRALIGDRGTEFLLAAPEAESAPAGVCQLRYRLSVWTGADDCWLEDLYVADDARRAGLGGALVDAAVKRAEARGCRRMELDVNEENAHALAFYRSLGFTTEPKPPGRTLFVARRLEP
jgi:ribosomal protein S18 acetylase RimI-like enzyme